MGIFKRLLSPFRSKKKRWSNDSMSVYSDYPTGFVSPKYHSARNLYDERVNLQKYKRRYSDEYNRKYKDLDDHHKYKLENYQDSPDYEYARRKYNVLRDGRFSEFLFSRKKRRFGTRNLIEEAMLRARIHNMPGHSSKKYKKYK